MIMQYKLTLELYGFEKDPGDALVICVPLADSMIEPLQILLKDDLIGYHVPITKKHQQEFTQITNIELNIKKLDFTVSLVNPWRIPIVVPEGDTHGIAVSIYKGATNVVDGDKVRPVKYPAPAQRPHWSLYSTR